MLTLPNYLLCSNKKALSDVAGLLLYTKSPFYFGKVWLFGTLESYESHLAAWINRPVPVIKSKLDGYWIVITLEGSLDSHTDAYKDDLQDIADGMAQMYFNERVAVKTGFYRKYQER